jgi:hypothetical protein
MQQSLCGLRDHICMNRIREQSSLGVSSVTEVLGVLRVLGHACVSG